MKLVTFFLLVLVAAIVILIVADNVDFDKVFGKNDDGSNVVSEQLSGLFKSDPKVEINLNIPGCTCSRRSQFDLTWDNQNSVNTDLLIQLLLQADAEGRLLCDCRDNGDLVNQVESIKYIYIEDGNLAGITIQLRDEAWLEKSEIKEKLKPIIEENRTYLLGDMVFKII